MISPTIFINPIFSVNKSDNSRKNISFCGVNKVDKFVPNAGKILSKLKQYSTEEYKTLSEEEKQYLRDMYRDVKTTDDMFVEDFHDLFSDRLKDKFDRKYGKGKYSVITIGCSLSSIGKSLGYKIGEENVINIPMSGAGRYLNENYLESLKADGSIKNFSTYLESVGLTKEKVQSSDKKFIVMDFCVSGDSLRGAAKLLKRDDVLGEKNIIPKNALKMITNTKLRNYANECLMTCFFKDYSFVKSAQTLNNLEAQNANMNEKSLKVQLTLFKILDNYMTKSTESGKSSFWKKYLNPF